jgi:divalent metal cation (Fe/Co/Zn/Cd) transporter
LKEAVIELADGDPFGTVKRQATEYLNSIDRPHVSSHQVRIRKLGPYLAIEAVVELDLEKYRETKQAIACIETIKEKLKARFPAARFISVRDQQLEICGTKLKLLPWLRLNLAPTTSM